MKFCFQFPPSSYKCRWSFRCPKVRRGIRPWQDQTLLLRPLFSPAPSFLRFFCLGSLKFSSQFFSSQFFSSQFFLCYFYVMDAISMLLQILMLMTIIGRESYRKYQRKYQREIFRKLGHRLTTLFLEALNVKMERWTQQHAWVAHIRSRSASVLDVSAHLLLLSDMRLR